MARRLRAIAVVATTLAICTSCTSGGTGAAPASSTVATAQPGTVSTTTTLPDTAVESTQDVRTVVPGVLTVGTESLTPPWYIGSTPATVTSGFEFDVAKALAARLHVPSVSVVVTPLVRMLSGADCGCDLMLSEVVVTDGRARDADLTEPYLTVDQAVLVRAGTSMSSVDEGRPFRWGVALQNSAGLNVIEQRIRPVAPPDVLVDEKDGIQRVADGRLDAMIVQTPTALAAAAANPALSVAGQLRTGELFAAVLTLGSPNTAALNGAIGDMRDDGTIAFFLRHYFGQNPADVPEIPS